MTSTHSKIPLQRTSPEIFFPDLFKRLSEIYFFRNRGCCKGVSQLSHLYSYAAVLDPSKNINANLTSVLDLDMAYSFDTFVNTIEPDPEFFTDEENLEIQQGKYGT